jgi:uncharacterized protein YggE
VAFWCWGLIHVSRFESILAEMRKGVVILLPLLFCSVAFGQLDSNSITVSASNNASLQPDQAIFSVSIQSGFNTGLDDVLAALQASGITAANFSGIRTVQNYNNGVTSTSLGWYFTLPAPLANTKATVASLTTVQQNIANLNNGLTLSFSIAGTQVSQQLAQSQTCSLSSLIAAATAQAQSLATAGGVTLGAILAMSGSTSNVVSSPPNFQVGPGFVSSSGGTLAYPFCGITVKFNVTRH